jgi:methionyl-tRNA formyltransferase
VTYARRLRPEDGDLDQDLTAVEIDRKVRALNPEPGCWITLAGARVKLLEGSPRSAADGGKGHPVPSREGIYLIRTVQPPGGRPMPVQDYLRGRR